MGLENLFFLLKTVAEKVITVLSIKETRVNVSYKRSTLNFYLKEPLFDDCPVLISSPIKKIMGM